MNINLNLIEHINNGTWLYFVFDGVVHIEKYTGKDPVVKVPADIDGIPVKFLEDGVFLENSIVEEIEVSSGVFEIKTNVFCKCDNLKKITLPATVDFNGIPFGRNPKLETIAVDPESKHLKVVDGVLYNDDMTFLYVYPAQKADKSFTIPASVESVRDYAFSCAANLEEVTLSEKITQLKYANFFQCSALKKVNFVGSNLNKIGTWCFAETGFEEIEIPSGVRSVDANAFTDCKNLKSIIFPNTLNQLMEDWAKNVADLTVNVRMATKGKMWQADWNKENRKIVWNFGTEAAVEAGGPAEVITAPGGGTISFDTEEDGGEVIIKKYTGTAPVVEIPEVIGGKPVTQIYSKAFVPAKDFLTEVKIANSVKKIDNTAFEDCKKLAKVTFGTDLQQLGKSVFYGTALETVILPEGLTSMQANCFCDCPNLTKLYLPKTLRSIGGAVEDKSANLHFYCGGEKKGPVWNPSWNQNERPVDWNVDPASL